MQTARLFVAFTLVSFGAAFAQSTLSTKTTEHHDKPSPAKSDSKAGKDKVKAAKKDEKEAAKSSAKKSDNAHNGVYSQAYKTSVPKP
jgi:hypothetical protein